MNDPNTAGTPPSRLRRATRSVTRHPVLTAVLVLAALVLLVLSALIGLPVVVTAVLLAVVGVGAWLLLRWWSRGLDGGEARPGWLALGAVALSGLVTFAVIQLVPYGRSHSNPEGSGEPDWADPATRELMVDACYSCHSDQTEYPFYTSIAPVSWATQRHIDEGREAVDYSEFATDPGEADETVDVIEDGEMPPAYYTRFGLHPEANLTGPQREALIAGLRATPGMTESDGEGDGDGDGD